MDWNWFFSGFAQCAAALVGIISAFVISKLLSTGDSIEQIDKKIDNLIIQAKNVRNRASKAEFDWYCKTHIESDSAIKGAIADDVFRDLDDNAKQNKLLEINPKLIKNPKNISFLRQASIPHLPLRRVINPEAEKMKVNKLEIIHKEYWNLKFESEKLIELLENLFSEVQGISDRFSSLRNIIIMLSISFIFTVVYPLHFLPLKIGETPILAFSLNVILDFIFSFKGFMIELLTICIGGIFVYFLLQVRKMKIKCLAVLRKKKPEILSIEEYNVCF